MNSLVTFIIGAAAIAIFIWLLRGDASSSSSEVIDPDDARQIGMLVGVSGGTIADAAVAKYALERFEKTQGRKATVREMGMVIGMMQSGL